jgi:hypothetical protein
MAFLFGNPGKIGSDIAVPAVAVDVKGPVGHVEREAIAKLADAKLARSFG